MAVRRGPLRPMWEAQQCAGRLTAIEESAAMWMRFTEHARHAVFFAQQEAGRRGASEVPPEYLLLGLLQEQDTAATRILDRLGVPRAHLRADVERLLPPCSRRCEAQ